MHLPKFTPLVAACLLLQAPALWADSLNDGLVAHWPLNKLHGETVKDLGPKHYDATAEEVNLVEGRGTRVMAFDGAKSGVLVPDEPAFEITGDFSVSFWVRIEPDTVKDGPMYAQPEFAISNFKGGLRVTFRHPDYSKTGYADAMGPKLNDGAWHHVVFALDAHDGEAVLYVDGLEAGAGKFPHLPEVKGPTTIGTYGRFHFEGELSDLRVYARTLDSGDVGKLNSAKIAP